MKKFGFYLLFFSFTGMLFACINNENTKTPDQTEEPSKTSDLINKIQIPTDEMGEIDSSSLASIVYNEEIYFFDTVKVGTKISHDFSFTNQGANDLFIVDTQSSCGCTVADYNKEAIKTGESGSIRVEFDTKERFGKQKKQIIVFTNSYPNKSVLTLQGYVDNPSKK